MFTIFQFFPFGQFFNDISMQYKSTSIIIFEETAKQIVSVVPPNEIYVARQFPPL